MSASCPAGECDFTGATEAVFGHIGGCSDPAHGSVCDPDLLNERGSEGPSTFALLAGGVGIAISLYLVFEGLEARESGSEDPALVGAEEESKETEGSEGASKPLLAGPAGGDQTG